MKLTSKSFRDGGAIPAEFAFAVVNSETHACFGTNRNPQLGWSDVPQGRKSFALICQRPRRAKPSRSSKQGGSRGSGIVATH
jgi:phosphatidylethanolamine-binding protein (PEBP) family uncharacterized protein